MNSLRRDKQDDSTCFSLDCWEFSKKCPNSLDELSYSLSLVYWLTKSDWSSQRDLIPLFTFGQVVTIHGAIETTYTRFEKVTAVVGIRLFLGRISWRRRRRRCGEKFRLLSSGFGVFRRFGVFRPFGVFRRISGWGRRDSRFNVERDSRTGQSLPEKMTLMTSSWQHEDLKIRIKIDHRGQFQWLEEGNKEQGTVVYLIRGTS